MIFEDFTVKPKAKLRNMIFFLNLQHNIIQFILQNESLDGWTIRRTIDGDDLEDFTFDQLSLKPGTRSKVSRYLGFEVINTVPV